MCTYKRIKKIPQSIYVWVSDRTLATPSRPPKSIRKMTGVCPKAVSLHLCGRGLSKQLPEPEK